MVTRIHEGTRERPPPVAPIPGATLEIPYASWGRRFVAFVVDCFVVWLSSGLFGGIVAIPIAVLAAVAGGGEDLAYAVGLLVGLLWLFIGVPFYFALFHAYRNGQTAGKELLGIAVRDESDLGRVSLGRALGREYLRFGLWLLYLLFVIDHLRPLWNSKHQSWHDSVGRTVVIRVRPDVGQGELT